MSVIVACPRDGVKEPMNSSQREELRVNVNVTVHTRVKRLSS